MRRIMLSLAAALLGSFALIALGEPPMLPATPNVAPGTQPAAGDLAWFSQVGRGGATTLRLRDANGSHIERFDSAMEEFAPGRNSGANEWSAFGVRGDRDFNCMGRDLYVRYPIFDLAFRLRDGDKEIAPDSLESFRLGLVGGRYPAIWGGWRYNGLIYKVSAMTVPDEARGNYDLYKLEVQNPTDAALPSVLSAVLEGPPDMRLADGVVRGLGDAPMVITDPSAIPKLVLRDWGLCEKRAKAYGTGDGPGQTEPAVRSYRLGLDGVPVTYRFKAQPGKKYLVCLVATPHISGYLLKNPSEPGDLVCEYRAEGAALQTLDYIRYLRKKSQPLFAALTGVRDMDGDGYIEVSAGVSDTSRIKPTRLSVIYVFPEATKISDPAAVYSGSMNAQCVHHIDVGATPEQGATNQHYDKSDVGFARLLLPYSASVPPHQTASYWLKVPPIHRREPVSMGYISHAFREVLPGESVPPYGGERVASLKDADPRQAEQRMRTYWDAFYAKAAKLVLPDPVLNDMYLSRLATRSILDVSIMDGVVYNACSPFFYFDHAYRDQAYVIFANDLAGLHDRAAAVLHGYCMDVKDVTQKGAISFDGKPLQLGMLDNGLWLSRPGQWDSQGQGIWTLVQHYKLSGDRAWLEKTAYPYIRRAAMWLVNSRTKHMKEVGNPEDPRYGLLEPGAMEVLEVGKGMHMYYLSAFGVLGLREAADAARSLGRQEDAKLFGTQAAELKESLHRSFTKTFKRTGMYEGNLFFGTEPEGVGMYGFWAHNCLLWPCRALEPHDPMLDVTYHKMERMSADWGGGVFSEGKGGYWPYIGVDRAVSYILRGEPDRALEYFCAYVDVAGGTLSWGEGYGNVIAGGDQPHMWADAQYVNLLRHLFVMEDGGTLLLTPALPRRWHQGVTPTVVRGLPTHFGNLDLSIQPTADGSHITYELSVSPQGDQDRRPLDRIVLYPRTSEGRAIRSVTLDGQPLNSFTPQSIILAQPPRAQKLNISVESNGG